MDVSAGLTSLDPESSWDRVALGKLSEALYSFRYVEGVCCHAC